MTSNETGVSSQGESERFEDPSDFEEVDRPMQVFASGHVEEWDAAVNELREVLSTLEDVDWIDWQERADAEEAIDMRLPEVQNQLHDAYDSVRRARDE